MDMAGPAWPSGSVATQVTVVVPGANVAIQASPGAGALVPSTNAPVHKMAAVPAAW
jgi:hypothetical protein